MTLQTVYYQTAEPTKIIINFTEYFKINYVFENLLPLKYSVLGPCSCGKSGTTLYTLP